MDQFGDYPPNMRPQDAFTVRQEASADLDVVRYTGEDLLRPRLGPANPFRNDELALQKTPVSKRKTALTGMAEETMISEHTFRSKHQAIERKGGPARELLSGIQIKKEARTLRAAREGKGNATVAEGDGAYIGPWAKYKLPEFEEIEVEDEAELGSDEDYEIVEEEVEEEEVIRSGTVIKAPQQALEKRKEVEALGDETSTFHGESEYDYQGRHIYMHVPQDLDVNLRKEVGSETNYIPRKQMHAWKHHTAGITALRLFPRSSHLGLSAAQDNQIKLFDIYHNRSLLRTFSGHHKAVCDLDFNRDGTRFLSSSFDKRIKVWDTETGQCTARFKQGSTSHVVRFSPGDEHAHEFLAGTNKKILQYDSRSGNEPVQEYDHHLNAINTLTFIEDGNRFISTSDDKSLRVWDYGIPVPIKYIAEPDMFALTRACRHPSGKYVLFQSANNEILAYSAGDKFRQNRKKSWRGHNTAGSAIDVACSPDGQFVASGDSAGYVVFWDYKTTKMYHKIKAIPGASGGTVNCVVWSEQETSKVLTAGADAVIRLWD